MQQLTTEEINRLVMENQSLLWGFVLDKTRKFPEWDKDELFQVAFFGARKAITKFDPTKGAKLTTFMSRYIINEIKSYCKVQLRYKKRYHTNTVDYSLEKSNRYRAEFHSGLDERIADIEGGQKITEILNKEDLHMVQECILNKTTMEKYSKSLGLSRQAVSARWKKIQKKFQHMFPEYRT